MTEHATLAIELTDDELFAVSGGGSTHVTVGISQRNRASAGIAQFGGSVSIGGGSGATTNSGDVSVSQSFGAEIGQTQSNDNSGNVTATITATSSSSAPA
jgi:hypothetical protein